VPGFIRLLTPALTVTLARAGFSAVLLPWFVIGGLTKVGGLSLSVGPPAGVWPLSLGAYYAFLPELMTNGDEPNVVQHVFVWSMTLSELILPVMVAAGLFGRLSAALMVAHIWAASAVAGHLFTTGRLFDSSPFDPGPDQMVLWSLVLLPVAIHGAGPLSIDGILSRWQRRRIPPF
jgi:uncharacterized membrane protein YphA (DoxX/SURF4 family)